MGECEPCKALNINSCPCGKRLLTQDELINHTSCTKPVPVCGQQCGKFLECGPPGVLTCFGTVFIMLVHFNFYLNCT